MASTQQQPQLPTEIDPISKFKLLLPHLKESLQTLLKVSAQMFNQHSQVDGCVRASEGHTLHTFEKALEEFYAVCDQIELSLKLALECSSQAADSAKNTPMIIKPEVQPPQQPPAPPDAVSYPVYLNTVRLQVSCAKEVHDTLLEYARKIYEHPAL